MDFVTQLRSQSHYPYLRGIVRFLVVMGYLLAALVALLAVVMFLKMDGPSIVAAVGLGTGAVLIVAAVGVVRELMLMLADIADGVIYVAQAQSEQLPPAANQDW